MTANLAATGGLAGGWKVVVVGSAALDLANSQCKCNRCTDRGGVGRGLGSGGTMAMNYRQLNVEERSALAALRTVGVGLGEIAQSSENISRSPFGINFSASCRTSNFTMALQHDV